MEMNKRMITISDIAQLAGVAKSTVSRYLNGGFVSDATREKIERIINETGYVPNAFAQSLKAKKTNIIGAIVPRLDSYASSQILIGIDEKLREFNYQMLISNTSQDVEREIESIYSLANQKAAGIILIATQVTEAHLEAIKKVNIPVVLVGQKSDNVYSVIHDDYSAAYDMGKYLLEKGYRKIAYLGVTEKDISVGVNRREGFKRAISERENCEVRYYETSFIIEEAVTKASEIIEDFKPSIIVCATDNIAMGTLKAAQLKGIRVPLDLGITGFGGYEVTQIIHPTLTTVKLYFKDAGRTAADSIIKLINEDKVPSTILSKYKIIEGESIDNNKKME
jgi:LacI family transcriptional regulator, sucrose operon repressor